MSTAQKRHPRFNKGRRIINLGDDHPAIKGMTTIFPTRIFTPKQAVRVLKSGHHSRKVGVKVLKGRWKGMPIFTLTTTERETCPTACREWGSCYGSHMQFAQRIKPGPELEDALAIELGQLQRQHPTGFVVRLHVLGDFYSVEYIQKWHAWLRWFPALRVMGFTAHPRMSLMGKMLAQPPWSRWAMRFSGSVEDRGAMTFGDGDIIPSQVVMCPAQTDKTESCGTCGFCWNSTRPVGFERH